MSETVKKRHQIYSACVPCRNAHVACDKERPCGHCVSKHLESWCIDIKRNHSGGRKKMQKVDTVPQLFIYVNPQEQFAAKQPLQPILQPHQQFHQSPLQQPTQILQQPTHNQFQQPYQQPLSHQVALAQNSQLQANHIFPLSYQEPYGPQLLQELLDEFLPIQTTTQQSILPSIDLCTPVYDTRLPQPTEINPTVLLNQTLLQDDAIYFLSSQLNTTDPVSPDSPTSTNSSVSPFSSPTHSPHSPYSPLSLSPPSNSRGNTTDGSDVSSESGYKSESGESEAEKIQLMAKEIATLRSQVVALQPRKPMMKRVTPGPYTSVGNNPVSVAIVSFIIPSGEVIECNRSFRKVFHISKQLFSDQFWIQRITPKEKLENQKALFKNYLTAEAKSLRGINTLCKLSGSQITVELMCTLSRPSTGPPVVTAILCL